MNGHWNADLQQTYKSEWKVHIYWSDGFIIAPTYFLHEIELDSKAIPVQEVTLCMLVDIGNNLHRISTYLVFIKSQTSELCKKWYQL